MIFAICVQCGGYLDRDDSICRACGADNDPAAGDTAEIELDPSLQLDRLGEWSHVKHEIVEKYASAYARILSSQPLIKRFVYIDGFAGAGVAVDVATGDYVPGSALRALAIRPAFHEYHFIELDDRKRRLLDQLTADEKSVTIHRGDCNLVLTRDVLPRCRFRTSLVAFAC